jgi:flagellar biosynthetic protein FliQ
MDDAAILSIGQEALWLFIKVALPIMLVGLVVGLAISLFQALTQIQEMTLTFVPKIVAMFFALMILLPYIGSELMKFTEELRTQIIGVAPHPDE